MSLKEIQSKLLLWEASENPLAPLTADQREAILDLESLILGVSNEPEEVCIYLRNHCYPCINQQDYYSTTSVLGNLYKNDVLQDKSLEESSKPPESSPIPPVDSTFDFLDWYEDLCEKNIKADDSPYEAYYRQLEDRRNECVSLNNQVCFLVNSENKRSLLYLLADYNPSLSDWGDNG